MPGVDEDLIRQITEKVTREVVAALTSKVEDEYPDYDEFPTIEAQDAPQEATASPLRARLTQGVVDVAPVIEDDNEGIGDVVPVGAVASAGSGGYQPSDDWLTAQWNRLPASYRQPSGVAGWATEAWSEVAERVG